MSNCMLVKANHSAGYRCVRVNGRTDYAHRVAFRAAGGVIPDGYTIDHLCRVRNCVNPNHLEAVTPGENVRRGGPYRRQSHCHRGHPMEVRGGRNTCPDCGVLRKRVWYESHHPEAKPRSDRRPIAVGGSGNVWGDTTLDIEKYRVGL